jgi:poly(3-hydroxybutyrate) depolymerase
VEDVGFMRAIVEQVSSRGCVDQRRIYATGMSKGGMMSFHLACDASDMFAARGVPILSFLGTSDMLVTYSTANPQSEMWATRNQCKTGPVMESHRGSTCKVWKDCRERAEVRVCSMMGMGRGEHGHRRHRRDVGVFQSLPAACFALTAAGRRTLAEEPPFRRRIRPAGLPPVPAWRMQERLPCPTTDTNS